MTASALINEIIEILYAGITGVAGALGKGLSDLVSGIIYSGTGESQTISSFFTIVLVFAGVTLALSLGRWVLNFVTSMGNKNS